MAQMRYVKPKPPEGTRFYQLDMWLSSEGEWPVHPYCIEEVLRHGHREYEERNCRCMILVLMLDGGLLYKCGNEPEFAVGKGKALIIPQGSDYSFHSTASRHYHKLVLEFKGPLLDATAGMLRLNRRILFEPRDFEALLARFRKLGALIKSERQEDIPPAVGLTHELLTEIAQETRNDSSEQKLLEKAKSVLGYSLDSRIGIASLAAELGVCHSLLDKLFRKELGVSPREYRKRRRISEAKHLLSQTSLPIKEISHRMGYANQLYFSNDFKRNCGVSPRMFRRSPSLHDKSSNLDS